MYVPRRTLDRDVNRFAVLFPVPRKIHFPSEQSTPRSPRSFLSPAFHAGSIVLVVRDTAERFASITSSMIRFISIFPPPLRSLFGAPRDSLRSTENLVGLNKNV